MRLGFESFPFTQNEQVQRANRTRLQPLALHPHAAHRKRRLHSSATGPLVFLAPIVALLALCPVACSGESHGEEGCGELCEAITACPNADSSKEVCTKGCTADFAKAEKNGCADPWNALAECRSHAEDICDADATKQECTIQEQAYADCLP